jgi:hypothetical protein
MVKKAPVMQLVGTTFYPTKAEAEQFAIEQRKKRNEAGMKARYEIDMDPQTGQFRVREFFYQTDKKGKLV